MACLGVGGAAGGGKLLLVQLSQLAGQDVCLLGKAFGAVGLLLQLQVVGLQAASPSAKLSCWAVRAAFSSSGVSSAAGLPV